MRDHGLPTAPFALVERPEDAAGVNLPAQAFAGRAGLLLPIRQLGPVQLPELHAVLSAAIPGLCANGGHEGMPFKPVGLHRQQGTGT